MFAVADLGAKVLAVDMDQVRLADDAWSDLVNLNLSTAYWTAGRHVERLCDQSEKLIMVTGRVRDREDAPCLS